MIRIIDNDDDRFPGHTLIAGFDDQGVELWRSWAPDGLDPAVRLNPDDPIAVDDRTTTPPGNVDYRVPTIPEYQEMTGVSERQYLDPDPDPGQPCAEAHKVLATYAAVTVAVTVDDAAKAVELAAADLVDEATAWDAAATIAESVRASGSPTVVT